VELVDLAINSPLNLALPLASPVWRAAPFLCPKAHKKKVGTLEAVFTHMAFRGYRWRCLSLLVVAWRGPAAARFAVTIIAALEAKCAILTLYKK